MSLVIGCPRPGDGTTDSLDGRFTVGYTITTQGLNELHATLAVAGGLQATYFSANDLTSAVGRRERDMTIDFSGTGDDSSSSLWPGGSDFAADGGPFSTSWRGYVRPKVRHAADVLPE